MYEQRIGAAACMFSPSTLLKCFSCLSYNSLPLVLLCRQFTQSLWFYLFICVLFFTFSCFPIHIPLQSRRHPLHFNRLVPTPVYCVSPKRCLLLLFRELIPPSPWPLPLKLRSFSRYAIRISPHGGIPVSSPTFSHRLKLGRCHDDAHLAACSADTPKGLATWWHSKWLSVLIRPALRLCILAPNSWFSLQCDWLQDHAHSLPVVESANVPSSCIQTHAHSQLIRLQWAFLL